MCDFSVPVTKDSSVLSDHTHSDADKSLTKKIAKIIQKQKHKDLSKRKQDLVIFKTLHVPSQPFQSDDLFQDHLSLEELSIKFIEIFIQNQQRQMTIDQVADILNVQRRKTYDIINIMNSIRLFTKLGKNLIVWEGLNSFQRLVNSQSHPGNTPSRQAKQKQLEYLSSGIIRLFLTTDSRLSLEHAAALLKEHDEEPEKLKTKIRRLYDIANVFKSIGIIRKIKLGNNKPGYEWVGLAGLQSTIRLILQKDMRRRQLMRLSRCRQYLHHLHLTRAYVKQVIVLQHNQQQADKLRPLLPRPRNCFSVSANSSFRPYDSSSLSI